ncbi:hypothetical protein MKW98_010194 [Papaver atlanticum]|uniref:Uncharacterized protein n=1 Tax=Papaver atlanticum TaxID=357466 RepID=A0AAD4SLV0_9MAGN|nr:hypothetical protein MKW98_010194 [Papaver atlanticum]
MEEAGNKATFNSELIVKIKGETMIPPAEETPKDLHFLSNLDTRVHMIDTIYSEVIKDGLAKVLVHYYPVAGRIIKNEKGKFMVHCTGEGVLFVEAEANLMLDETGDFTKPDPATYGKLVYGLLDPRNILQNPLLVAQVTKFKCGGFVLGLSMNHAMADGTSTVEFMRSWGEVTRGLPLTSPPFLDRTILTTRNPPKVEFTHGYEDIVDVSNTKAIFEQEILLTSYFGNAFLLMNCQCSVSEMLDSPLSSTIERIQRSIKMVADEYVKSTVDFLEEPKAILPHSSTVFLSPPTLPIEEVVLFISHGMDNKGINLIIGLPASSMKIFEESIEI